MTIWTPELPEDGPRYRRIADAMADAITRGELAPGERLPPQRRLADQLGVTIGTITRAYAEAQRQGWVESRVGSGTYVRHREAESTATFRAGQPVENGVVDMSMSLPPPHPLRPQGLRDTLLTLAEDSASLQRAVDYQPEYGLEGHRHQLAEWLGRLGMSANPDSLVITQGGQHGLTLALQALTRPGELVAADALTYPGFIGAARQAHLKLLGVPLDEQGMDIDALARLCARQPPRLVYTTPEQNNPTGACLTEARRERLVALAREHDFWLIEDNVQYLPEADRGTPLIELAPERTLRIFSTSKVLAGGLRIGTLELPEPLLGRIGSALRAQTWMVPPLMVETTCRWIASDASRRLLDWQTRELEARQRLARQRLANYPTSGRERSSNLWVTLPAGRRGSEVQELLAQRGVRVSTPEPFCVGSEPAPQALRLCLGPPASQEELDRGLCIILETLAEPPCSPWHTM
ncbi:PLP-dependent aminotransferase family protein [Halomonas caseinilytica]|uniref:aminotransferase-like domain-containing protein n=1 Tax=Halomonas caseinilytica TaxID=438744 RepID=UPI0007E5534C|nr:PLP-dependent aminotransferase family protein [Halomonas caseinilytica]SEM90712.1 transcriptional regulator, GntR family [Halomonas caseinilytica]